MAWNPRTDPKTRASTSKLVRLARQAARSGDCQKARGYFRVIVERHHWTVKHATVRRLNDSISRSCRRR